MAKESRFASHVWTSDQEKLLVVALVQQYVVGDEVLLASEGDAWMDHLFETQVARCGVVNDGTELWSAHGVGLLTGGYCERSETIELCQNG